MTLRIQKIAASNLDETPFGLQEISSKAHSGHKIFVPADSKVYPLNNPGLEKWIQEIPEPVAFFIIITAAFLLRKQTSGGISLVL